MADSRHDKLESVADECRETTANNGILVETSLCNVTNKTQVIDAISCADELASTAASSSASILVNCAGITRDARIGNLSDTDWDDVLDVNLKGTFLMCQEFCDPERISSHLMSGNNASIINIGSIVSKYGNIGQVNYAASKGGVVGLTRSLAKEMASFSWKVNTDFWGDKGAAEVEETVPPMVRVNCIQPGKANNVTSWFAGISRQANFI